MDVRNITPKTSRPHSRRIHRLGVLGVLLATFYCAAANAEPGIGDESDPADFVAALPLDDGELAKFRGKNASRQGQGADSRSDVAVILWDEGKNGTQSGKHTQTLGMGNVQSNSLNTWRP